MKRVLILAYDFPPYVSVGGLRPFSWYKYFHEFGVYPIVVTRQWGNKYGNHLDYIAPGTSPKVIIEESEIGTIIRAPYKPNLANRIMLKYGEAKHRLLRKIISAYYDFFQFILFIGPKVSLYFAANGYLKRNKVDLIIATGDPFVLFRYASKLGKKFNTPWIADYRDPWNYNSHKFFLVNYWYLYLEKKMVKNAKIITTVNPYFKYLISKDITNKDIIILPNGFDPNSLTGVEDIQQQSEMLKIAYVGYIYNWHPLRSFLSVVSKFVGSEKDAKILVSFYGINNPETINLLITTEFPNIRGHVNIYPKTPNNLLMKELARENLLLLFNYYVFPGTKIYDYLALKRLILFCYEDDPEANFLKHEFYPYTNMNGLDEKIQERIIQETNSGYIIKDSVELLTRIKELYWDFLKEGYIKCDTINVDKYSRKHQVEKLAEIIRGASS